MNADPVDPQACRFQPAPPPVVAPVVRKAKPKTAIVMIHGMGEQRPMDTLWGFVRAAWTRDGDIAGANRHALYSKPEAVTGSFELRRVTTQGSRAADDRRMDFFEFYWANLMSGNTAGSVTAWFRSLFLRSPSTVPKGLKMYWFAGIVMLALAAVIEALSWMHETFEKVLTKIPLIGATLAGWPDFVWVGLGILVAAAGWVMTTWMVPVVGDAARYLSPDPDNVDARQKIREAGITLLTGLSDSGRYDRIVVVGHSLGSVIAYDVLNYAFGRLDHDALLARHQAGRPAMTMLTELEKAARALQAADAQTLGNRRMLYRSAQRAYRRALAETDAIPGQAWLVSDLVTLGSPLSKADILLASDPEAFRGRENRREAPTCPPLFEEMAGKEAGFAYPLGAEPRAPHHGAVFGPVVWTNLYFPAFFFIGDIVSGIVRTLFGQGVLDVALPLGTRPIFRHLSYWTTPKNDGDLEPVWVSAVRKAINLMDTDDSAQWGDAAEYPAIRMKRDGTLMAGKR